MQVKSMLVERKVRYPPLFTNLVRWHAGAVSLPLSDVLLAQLVSLLIDIMFCLCNLSHYKHCCRLQNVSIFELQSIQVIDCR